MVHISFLIGLAGLAAGRELLGLTAHKGSQANLLLPGANSAAFSVSASCSSFEETCDGYCVPSGSICCSDGDGSYCDAGDYCQANGCCPEGETCSGDPTGCNAGKELCGDYCIPTGSVCCDDAGAYCDSGDTCTSDGYCEPGSDGGEDETLGGSGNCYSFQDECDGYCIPADSVCCGDGYYCDAGETCESDGTCTVSLGGSDDEDDEDDEPQYTLGSPTPTTASSYSLPTFDDSIGDDDTDGDDTVDDDEAQDDDEEGSSLCKRKGGKGGDGGSIGGGGGGGGGGDDDECGGADAANGVTVPVVLAGIAAVLPFAL